MGQRQHRFWEHPQRHYEAAAPDKNVPLSEPIPSSRVTCHTSLTQKAILDIQQVEDVAMRRQNDGTLEAFVYSSFTIVTADFMKQWLRKVLHGYCIPDEFHVFDKPLPREDGEVDYHAMEEIIKEKNASNMSPWRMSGSCVSTFTKQRLEWAADVLMIDPTNSIC